MANFKKIDDGIFIGPQPAEQDLRAARQLGIQTVIDLRMPGESPISNDEMTKRNSLGYVNIPVDKTALTGHQINELEHAMERMPGPYLLHCATGARAALLIALSLARKRRWTAERTFQEAQEIGFNLEDSDNFAIFVREITAQ